MAILTLPAKNYLESVDRVERALMQLGIFDEFEISKGQNAIVVYVADECLENPQDLEMIYRSYEPPSA
jgi:hypothetical protein